MMKTPMFSTGEVNWKGELMANGNKATKDVHAWNRARIPCVKKEQDFLKSHTNRIALVAHYLEALNKISINTLNDHWVVICT
jgi:hypothetical protein